MSQIASLGQSRAFGLTLILISSGLWATVGIATQVVPMAVALPSDLLGVARTLLGGPTILLVAVLTGAFRRTHFDFGLCRAIVGFSISCAIFQICLFNAFNQLGLTLTVFLTVCLPPVLAVAVNRIQARAASQTRIGAPMALALAGLCLVIFAKISLASQTQWMLGLGNALGASVAFVVLSYSASIAATHAPPLMTAGLGLTGSGLLLALNFVATGEISALGAVAHDKNAVLLLVYLASGPTALAYICYCAGLARCRSAVTGLMATMVEPGVAAVLAALFIGEQLTLPEVLGCLLMGLALVALWKAETAAPRATDRPLASGVVGQIRPGLPA